MEDKTRSKLDRYISREFQIIAVIVGVLGAFYSMVLIPIQKQGSDLEYIKVNHLTHIEETLVEVRQKQACRDLNDAERDIKVERILVILEGNVAP